jgi:ubiquinone/menaquinone biosynthesis C-methylase UbiE
MSFNDHFSKQTDIYLKARPTYPEALFNFLASICPKNEFCWDNGAGNGQASIALAKHFKKVLATDASAQQINNGIPRDNIEYKVALAEESGLPDKSVDLITVATAAHWFNLDKFYKEAERVAMPNGVLALWTYSSASINVQIDPIMEWFAYDYLHDYWPDGRWYVRNSYKTLPFPFKEMETPAFTCNMRWNLSQWLDYLRSWSSYNRYLAKHNADPLEVLMPKLKPLWAENEIKEVVWPLHLKCTRLNCS